MNYPKPNCFEKKEVRWQKYFKIMVKLAQNSIRSTELSIAYSPCYSIVLMRGNGGVCAVYFMAHYTLLCTVFSFLNFKTYIK